MIRNLILKKYDKRDLIYAAVFGCLWGLNEITLGTFLKSFRIPFSGAILSSIAAIIICVSSFLNYKKGTIILTGVVAAVIKLSFLVNFLFGPIIAIILEGFIGEIIYRLIKNSLMRCLLTGIFLGLYSIIHLVVTNIIIFGLDFYRIYLELINQVIRATGLTNLEVWHFILIYCSVYFITGLIAGILAYAVITQIKNHTFNINNERN